MPSTELKLCLATATHNFKWVKMSYLIHNSNPNISQSKKFNGFQVILLFEKSLKGLYNRRALGVNIYTARIY